MNDDKIPRSLDLLMVKKSVFKRISEALSLIDYSIYKVFIKESRAVFQPNMTIFLSEKKKKKEYYDTN